MESLGGGPLNMSRDSSCCLPILRFSQLCVCSSQHLLNKRAVRVATNQSARLEFATNLPAVWQDAAVPPALSNGQFVVQWTNAVPRVFFRLRGW